MSPAADDPRPPAGGALSEAVLAELREVGGEGLVRELMATFAEGTPERLRSVERAAAAGDLAAAAAALHSLCSASGTVGARRLAELAGRLERAARGGQRAVVDGGLEELRRATGGALAVARELAATGDG